MSTFILPPKFKVYIPILQDQYRAPTSTEACVSTIPWIMVETTLPTVTPGRLHVTNNTENTYPSDSDDESPTLLLHR